jgi:hypothetical protein
MILCWHIVSLIPISFPLTKNWESWVNLKLNRLWSSLSVTWTNISNIIIIIESMDVSRQRNSHAINCILSMTWIDMRHIVNSWKLTIDSCCFVKYIKVFINWYLTPMRNIYVSICLWEFRKREWICKEEL